MTMSRPKRSLSLDDTRKLQILGEMDLLFDEVDQMGKKHSTHSTPTIMENPGTTPPVSPAEKNDVNSKNQITKTSSVELTRRHVDSTLLSTLETNTRLARKILLDNLKIDIRNALFNILAQLRNLRQKRNNGDVISGSILNQICQEIVSNLRVLEIHQQRVQEFSEKYESNRLLRLLVMDIGAVIEQVSRFIKLLNFTIWEELEPAISLIIDSTRNLTTSLNAI
eukprot:TRINITY_DN12397_c0_g2_i2.p1 TRINITY_DN12397_c0_g2~~TRINITY_DN12397_c0_g2_i2.p1  ORF type:complete len:224 (+),score=42.62 TRINITY_DN12397_c0_g2_i2:97-768(+)